MRFRELTEQNQPQYHAFVAYHPQGSFLQSWEWGKWQTRLGKPAHRFFVEDETTNEILLSAQALLTPPPFLSKPYLYTPYGPLVNKELNPAQQQQAVELFLDKIKEQFPASMFLRAEPTQPLQFLMKRGVKSKNIQPARTLMLDLNKPEEELLKSMHNKTRYNIKVALRHEVEVRAAMAIEGVNAGSIDATVALITATSGRQGYKNHSRGYFKSFIEFFSHVQKPADMEVMIYQALFKGQLLATALMVDYGRTRTYLFGGTSNEHKHTMAPYALHWQAIRDAQSRGLECYDFYGIETAGGTTPGFVRFKLGFGGDTVEYPGAWDIIARPTWYTIYKALRLVGRTLHR